VEPMPPGLDVERDDAPWWGDLPGGPDDILANYMDVYGYEDGGRGWMGCLVDRMACRWRDLIFKSYCITYSTCVLEF